MPFKAERRHQYWTVDIRYLDMYRLGGGMIYVISILDNYSRAVLASRLFRTQDLAALLIVLFAAIRAFGSPEALVSGSGSIVKPTDPRRICAALGIRKEQIEQRQPWQSCVEMMFDVQRRMADWHFAKATSWKDLVASHDRWLSDYNGQEHWAHRKREDKRRRPQEVLGWVTEKSWALEELQQIFPVARGEPRVHRAGYVRFRNWDLHGEQGLARPRVAVRLAADAETMTVAQTEEPLAQYSVIRAADHQRLKDVTPLRQFETRLSSLQMALWEPGLVEWRLALRRPIFVRLHQHLIVEATLPLLFPEIAV